MTDVEMCEALYNGGVGETVKLSGGKPDLLAVMRHFKAEKLKVKGGIELDQSYYKGTNIRKIDVGDAAALFRVFADFTSERHEICRRPIVDAKGGGIVATDGWKMLVSRIPNGFDAESAVNCGFGNGWNYGTHWNYIVGDVEPTEYAMTSYRRLATVHKGSERHGLLQAVADAVKAYSHDDDEGCLNTIRLRIGKEVFDAAGVSQLVDAMFRLGCGMVALCERLSIGGRIPYYPLNLFGFGCPVAVKGMVMPLRYADESTGAFVMPLDRAAKDKNVA